MGDDESELPVTAAERLRVWLNKSWAWLSSKGWRDRDSVTCSDVYIVNDV